MLRGARAGTVLAVAAAVFCLSGIDAAYAQIYERGDYVCEDFDETERRYEEEQNVYTTGDYAYCLVLKGEDATGLSLINHLVDEYNDVFSAFFLAEYISSDGDLIPTHRRHWDTTSGILDKGIAAYHRVLSFINGKNYPGTDYDIIEFYSQYELRSHRNLIYLHLQKFRAGYIGLENWYLNSSPSYEGDRNQPGYPEYRNYTEDSLKKARDLAQTCIELPKKGHFIGYLYEYMVEKYCPVTKGIAEELLVMEREKLDLLYKDPSCRSYVWGCAEYMDIRQKMADTFNRYSQVKERPW